MWGKRQIILNNFGLSNPYQKSRLQWQWNLYWGYKINCPWKWLKILAWVRALFKCFITYPNHEKSLLSEGLFFHTQKNEWFCAICWWVNMWICHETNQQMRKCWFLPKKRIVHIMRNLSSIDSHMLFLLVYELIKFLMIFVTSSKV